MLWGGVGAGKTSLLKALQGGGAVIKTQMIEYVGEAIDSPGEYSEMGQWRRHLQTTAADVPLIIMVQDATRIDANFPPGYFLMFSQPVIGVVTKMDAPTAQPNQARAVLRDIGVTGAVYYVSTFTGAGLEELAQALNERRTVWQAVVGKPSA